MVDGRALANGTSTSGFTDVRCDDAVELSLNVADLYLKMSASARVGDADFDTMLGEEACEREADDPGSEIMLTVMIASIGLKEAVL